MDTPGAGGGHTKSSCHLRTDGHPNEQLWLSRAAGARPGAAKAEIPRATAGAGNRVWEHSRAPRPCCPQGAAFPRPQDRWTALHGSVMDNSCCSSLCEAPATSPSSKARPHLLSPRRNRFAGRTCRALQTPRMCWRASPQPPSPWGFFQAL